MKILIAEDDPASRLILQRTLEGMGHGCLVAEDGVEAWEVYGRTPDVEAVISDWMMPRMDGLELCRRVRSDKRERYTFFIMLTALTGKERLLEGLRAGADEYLTKPLDSEQLEARLAIAHRISALHRHVESGAGKGAARKAERGHEDPGGPGIELPPIEGDRAGAETWGILVSQGKVSEPQLQAALEAQKTDPREIGEILVSLGTISTVDLARARARRLGLAYVELDLRDIDPRAVDLLPQEVLLDLAVLPLRLDGERLFLATSDPTDVRALDEISSLSSRTVVPVVASAADIRNAQDLLFAS